jgi:surface carbohydrate biosynthesis protein
MKLTIQKVARPLIHLPIETKSREFDSRCLIALECARRGAIAVIGPATILPYKIPHVVLLKSASRFELARIRAEQAQGALSAVLDEEGIVHTADRREHAMRYSQQTLDVVDRVLLNGANEMGILDEHYRIDHTKCILTGNPRFDFYQRELAAYYEKEADEIVKRHGKFILIPSRFGNVNLARRVDFIQFQAKVRKLDPVTELPIFQAYHAHCKQLFSHFVRMLPILATKFPDHAVIVRPHPSERHDAWLEAAKHLKNVHVIAEGPIGPWLKAAKAVVHNGCTTGLEAFLMGRPVYAYMPIESELYDLHLPNAVSIKVFSTNELLEAVEAGLCNGRDCSPDDRVTRIAYASQHLANAGGQHAYDRIADELIALAHSHPEGLVNLRTNWSTRCNVRIRNLMRIVAAQLYRSGLPTPRFAEDAHYGFMKNPGVTLAELTGQLHRLARFIGIAPQDIDIRRLDANRFGVSLNSWEGLGECE